MGDTQTTIDDLWHAAVNGGGDYFNANDPNAVAVGLSKALIDIESKTASVGSADVSSSFMSPDSRSIYFSSFETISWIGDVKTRKLNLETNELEAVTWSASKKLIERGKLGHKDRKIYTCPETSCNSRTLFDQDNSAVLSRMSAGVNALKTSNGTMSSEQIAQNTAAALIDYLRGDQSNEIQPDAKNPKSLYRARKGLLGAVIHGGVSYVKKPSKAYSDTGYPAFLQRQSNRIAMTYAPANDGMLHAFNAETGAEEWAFVPPSIVSRLWQQAERAFTNDFKYFVDGAPTIADIQVGNTWKTILVAGLRGGGGEYYALDITDPLNPKPLWSFANSKLGKTYGFPVVGKVNGTWKVLLSSGYDNADNKGYLFALNANTGDLDNTFSSSCSNNEGLCALSKIGVLFENENVDDSIIMAYAGDLSGNLWRFNPKDGSSALVAKTGTALLPQAITTAPVIKIAQQKSSTNMPLHFITFGTGRYLKQADITSSDQHTFYGLLVDPSASVIDPAFTTLHSSMAIAELTFEHNSDGDSIKHAQNSGTTETINDCKKRIKGWRTNMIIDKERLANDPSQLGERATFITSIPGGNACEAGGFSRKYSFPMEISSNLICSSDIDIYVGDGKDGSILDDPSKNTSVMTPGGTGGTGETGGVGHLEPDGAIKFSEYPWKFKGRRSGWTEIVN
ncbi:MAG: PilC/PilY family type IV pilus protein [Proteobacteria bacterium]|nr:PilC/PilY family type IV pilus protein [Pseudomonadota bacterium]